MVTNYDRGRTGPLYASNSPTGSTTSSQRERERRLRTQTPGSPSAASAAGKRRSVYDPDPSPIESEEDSCEDEDELESKALMKASGMSKELLQIQLHRMAQGVLKPKIPTEPAPPQEWQRESQRVPASLLIPKSSTAIDRMLSSSMGRAFTFVLTLACFCTSAFCLMIWDEPQRRADGEVIPAVAGLVATLAMYTMIPDLARRAEMGPSPEGADWKPYLCIYRCSFLLSIPALLCLGFGYSARVGFGEPSPATTMADLVPDSLRYFQVSDGYVALNLTKGISETRSYLEHGREGALRRSRFRDAELRINREPFADIPEPTIPPGFLRLVRVAPIFAEWTECVTKYQISLTCLDANPVVGWAVAETKSLCTSFGMVSCRPPETSIEPVYMCNNDANRVFGVAEKGPVNALCGRVRKPPRSEAVDEMKALLMLEGWREDHLPNSTTVWINVDEDPCINQPQACLATWSAISTAGMAFSALTILSICLACCLDCRVDDQIRRARNVQAKQFVQPEKSLM